MIIVLRLVAPVKARTAFTRAFPCSQRSFSCWSNPSPKKREKWKALGLAAHSLMDGCVYVRLALYSKQTPKEEDTHLDNTSFHTSTRSGRRTFSWFLLILANVLWAGSYVAGKFALSELSVNMVNALRMSIAAWYSS